MALSDVSLEVPRGVVFALLGENGAGKSTLNKIHTGFVAADLGSVLVLGHDGNKDPVETGRHAEPSRLHQCAATRARQPYAAQLAGQSPEIDSTPLHPAGRSTAE